MLVSFKILFLLWLINFIPPFLAYLLDKKWSTPLDFGRLFLDGKPIFGDHKTIRGVIGGGLAGVAGGFLVGFPLWIGFFTGVLCMVGDLFSSFIKRRLGKPSGSIMPGLDQIFEGLFPFAVLWPHCELYGMQIVLLTLAFGIGAYAGSIFFKMTLLNKPFDSYHRPIRPRTRFREWRACQMANNPLHPFLNFERAIYYHIFMKFTFRILGLYERGKRNALQIKQHDIFLYFEDLPPLFDGYRILFLSDLHLDGLDGLTERLREIVSKLPVDLCILGGDFRTEMSGPFSKALSRLLHLTRKINTKNGFYAVLGNHDCLEMMETLNKRGINVLVNDAIEIEQGGDRIWLVGVDDPHYYQAHDLDEAYRNVPQKAFSIFLAHSPEVYREAAGFDANLYLCGHTHAGQIQFPVIGPLFTHSKAPRRMSQGVWEYRGMKGYTSSGAGVSGVNVRFGCQGEVACIILKRGSQTGGYRSGS